MDAGARGRANQRRRTRKALLEGAARLTREGRKPSLEEVAEAAMVSRATAYRYFPNIEALLVEAALDVAMPAPTDLFGADAPADPVARLERLDAAMDAVLAAHEPQFRMMLANAMSQALAGEDAAGGPGRQNRRTPLIEAALAPTLGEISPRARDRLVKALAVLLGTESMVVFKDVLQIDAAEARAVKRWAIRALVEAARQRD